jgi:hypothetical protein
LTGLIENLPAIVFIVITIILSRLCGVAILWMANKTSFRELDIDIRKLKFKLKK